MADFANEWTLYDTEDMFHQISHCKYAFEWLFSFVTTAHSYKIFHCKFFVSFVNTKDFQINLTGTFVNFKYFFWLVHSYLEGLIIFGTQRRLPWKRIQAQSKDKIIPRKNLHKRCLTIVPYGHDHIEYVWQLYHVAMTM